MTAAQKHETTEEFLAKMRREEAEMERKFPGYPPYVSEVVLQKIEWAVQRHAEQMHRLLSSMFGYVAMKEVTREDVEHWLHDLARNVAHQAAGHMAAEGALNAERASHNMLQACLAGIALSANDNTETQERETTDASTES